MDILKLRYQLTESEIKEALLCLEWKKESLYKRVNLWVISILGVILLIAYIRNPGQFFLFLLLCAIILLLLYLSYGPVYSRNKRAKKMTEQDGEYRLVITEGFIQYGEKNERFTWKERKIRLYFSENMCALKADRDVFAVPKRVLTEVQLQELVQMAKKNHAEIINVVIKKE